MTQCVKQIAYDFRCPHDANARGLYCDVHDPILLAERAARRRQEKRAKDAALEMLLTLKEIAASYPGSEQCADLASLARSMVRKVEGGL